MDRFNVKSYGAYSYHIALKVQDRRMYFNQLLVIVGTGRSSAREL